MCIFNSGKTVFFSLTFQPLARFKVNVNIILFFCCKVLSSTENTSRKKAESLCMHYINSLMCFIVVKHYYRKVQGMCHHLRLARMESWLQTVSLLGDKYPNTLCTKQSSTFLVTRDIPQVSHSSGYRSITSPAYICTFCLHSASYTACEVRHLPIDLLVTQPIVNAIKVSQKTSFEELKSVLREGRAYHSPREEGCREWDQKSLQRHPIV